VRRQNKTAAVGPPSATSEFYEHALVQAGKRTRETCTRGSAHVARDVIEGTVRIATRSGVSNTIAAILPVAANIFLCPPQFAPWLSAPDLGQQFGLTYVSHLDDQARAW
jgi:hypothetical protein